MTDQPAHKAAYRSIFRPGLFAGRVVIVTGGGTGIGRCTAHELAGLGASLALVGRRAAPLEATAREIEALGGVAMTATCDIRDEPRVAGTIAAILARLGRIDGLVNNAGGQFWSPIESISAKGWDAVVRNNLTGGFLMARECYTQWMAAHGGAIVNMAADMWHGMPGMAHSGAARAGMVNFTETAALEWSGANVRVNAVAPGWIATSGLDTYPPERGEYLRGRARLVPLGRYGTESEVSAAIVFLLSEAAAYITGTTVRVDGGNPNVKASFSAPVRDTAAPAFDGFHLAARPKVLEP